MSDIKVEPVIRLTFAGRDLGIFTEQELLRLRDEIDRLFGLDRLLSKEGFEVHSTIDAFCDLTGITWVALKGRTKTEPLLFHRQCAMEIVRQLCPSASQAAIGRAFGDRERSLVTHNQQAVEGRCKLSAKDRLLFESLRDGVIQRIHKQQEQDAAPKVVSL